MRRVNVTVTEANGEPLCGVVLDNLDARAGDTVEIVPRRCSRVAAVYVVPVPVTERERAEVREARLALMAAGRRGGVGAVPPPADRGREQGRGGDAK